MLTEICGVHCGIASGREGHCDCELCHDGTAPVVITRSDLLTVELKAPMCELWYERAGSARPWDPPPQVPAGPVTTREHIRMLEDLTQAPASQPPSMSDAERRDWEDEQVRGCRP